MRIFLLVFIAIIFYSCSGRKDNIEFNIQSNQLDIDTTKLKEQYDHFENQIQEELLTVLDTADLWNTFENLDSLSNEDLNKKFKSIGIEHFSSLFDEVNKPYDVKDYKKDIFHFEIINANFIIIEVSSDELIFKINQEQIQSQRIDSQLWNRLEENCNCSSEDILFNLFDISNAQGKQLYRLDILLNEEYDHCWKLLKKNDALLDILKMIENDLPPTAAKNP